MGKNFADLNVNPCKMCVPMGAVTAFYGIRKCMSILHGSQGCSTYIRRHMATHYNEPVDIASSSLTEQGTVFYNHMQYLIKTFWVSLIGFFIGGLTLALAVGGLILIVVSVWFVYRVVAGFIKLYERKQVSAEGWF